MTSLGDFLSTDRDQSTEEIDDHRLTLAYERLQSIPKTILDGFGPTTEILDISHNKIHNVKFLAHFTNLTSLIADNNMINETTIFPPMPKLELLWLNHCCIQKLFHWMRMLQQSCPNLKHICLMGNPAAPSYFNGGTFFEYLQYRLFVISLFPALTHLDDRAVTDDQRQEAKRLYQRPFLERLTSFSNSEVSMSNSAMQQWRNLHEKVSCLFDSSASSSSSCRRRSNLVI